MFELTLLQSVYVNVDQTGIHQAARDADDPFGSFRFKVQTDGRDFSIGNRNVYYLG